MKEIFNYPEEEMEKCIISTEPKIAVFIDNRSPSVCFDFGEVINNYNNIVNGNGKYKNTIETQ